MTKTLLVVAAALVATLLPSLPTAFAEGTGGVDVCFTNPQDVTPYSGTCDGAWASVSVDTPWAKACVDTLVDESAFACDSIQSDFLEARILLA